MPGEILPAYSPWSSCIPAGNPDETAQAGAAHECGGFTLVEALLSMTILALIATVVSAVYASGFQALELQGDRMLIDSALRSQMEFQLGNAFSDLSSGTTTVTVNGQNRAVTTVVVVTDLDGDAVPEPAAKRVTVSIGGRSLTAIVVDDEDKLGKI